MRTWRNFFVIAGILVAAALIGGVIGWLGSQSNADNPPTAAAMSSTPAEPFSQPAAAPTPKPVIPVKPIVSEIPDTRLAVIITNWNEPVQAILNSDTENTGKVRQLFALFPKLPPDGQVAVAEDFSELVPDENYAPLGELLKNPKLPDDVLEVLMNDAPARPNSKMLPLMLEIARNPQHPKSADAKKVLNTYLGKDCGDDWAQWQQQLTEWLNENPD